MKKTVALILIGIFSTAHTALACGGGNEITLNDDTILSVGGLRFPVTDPEGKSSIGIQDLFKQYQQCLKKNDYVTAVFRGACSMTVRVGDSKGISTHRVRMILERGTATYLVTDLNTGEIKVYEGPVGLRGGCGLKELN